VLPYILFGKNIFIFQHGKWPARGTGTVPVVSAHFRSLLDRPPRNSACSRSPHDLALFAVLANVVQKCWEVAHGVSAGRPHGGVSIASDGMTAGWLTAAFYPRPPENHRTAKY